MIKILAGCFLLVCRAGAAGGSERSDSLVTYGPYSSSLGEYVLVLPAHYPHEAEAYLRDLAADVILVLTSRFGPVEPAPFQMIVVSKRAELEAWVGGELPDWIHAIASERPPRVVMLGPAAAGSNLTGHRFEQTLLHELTHIYLYRLHPSDESGSLPGWFHEGLAVHAGGGLDRGMQRALVRGRLTGKFYTLAQLDRIHHTSSVLSELAYAQSVVAAQVMEDIYGRGVFRDIFDELRREHIFPTAFAQGTGESLERFYTRYDAEIRRRYNILLVLADPSVLFILLPFLVLVAYLVRLWRNRVITARWAAEREGVSEGLASESPRSDNANL
ncbi:MAG: hypothetical protein JSU61_06810 [Fidelibacterota bacterium]|nr:MAG: hypothetical protein JSU61_06810 [Candidatus Neomarinimicrobiota bacterium]